MKLAIIGGGSWGTALATVLAPRVESVALWMYEADLAARMASSRENDVFLPGFRLADNVQVVSANPGGAIEGADIVLGVMPSHHARGIYTAMLPHLTPSMILVSATKGLEQGSLLRMSQVIEHVVKARFEPRIAVLSGPTFAREVAAGNPTAVVVASASPEVARCVQEAFSGPSFRLYTNSDPAGVEVGAALKNVIAIGAGICEGLGLGHNPTAALITRGLAEITRLAVALGGEPATLAGLAGLGDLVLTSTGTLSRNRALGMALARGESREHAQHATRMVAEGVPTVRSALALAARHGVTLPIAAEVAAVLFESKPPADALASLLGRAATREDAGVGDRHA